MKIKRETKVYRYWHYHSFIVFFVVELLLFHEATDCCLPETHVLLQYLIDSFYITASHHHRQSIN